MSSFFEGGLPHCYAKVLHLLTKIGLKLVLTFDKNFLKGNIRYYYILGQSFRVNLFIYWSIQYWRLWHIYRCYIYANSSFERTNVPGSSQHTWTQFHNPFIYSFGGSTSCSSHIIFILAPTHIPLFLSSSWRPFYCDQTNTILLFHIGLKLLPF